MTDHGVIRRELLRFIRAIPGGVLKRRSVRLAPAADSLDGRNPLIISHHHLWVRCCELDIYSSRVGGVCQGGLKKMSRTEAKRGKKSNFFDKISKKP